MSESMEALELDILYVGAGPASLASAYHLSKLIQNYNTLNSSQPLENITIGILEKSADLGGHILSGAVMDPKALKELIPDFQTQQAPTGVPVTKNDFCYLTKQKAWSFPWTPYFLENRGYSILSLGRLVQWLGDKVQQQGVDLFLNTPGAEVLFEGDKVIGIQTAAKGLSRTGEKKSNFQEGFKIKSKVTVFGEGAFGNLSESVINKLDLRKGKNEAQYALGVKEIWKVFSLKHQSGKVVHTLGYPLKTNQFGGGWIYHMEDHFISIGFVLGLDYDNPQLDAHQLLQKYKTHPYIKELLSNATLVSYGAKSIFEGGYYAMPRLYGDGFLLIGESGGFLNSGRLKGIHLAIKSGMMAAETIFESLLQSDTSEKMLSHYQQKFESSWAKEELWKFRNFRQAFQKGLFKGVLHLSAQMLLGGRGFLNRYKNKKDYQYYKKKQQPEIVSFDSKLTFNKTSDLYLSGVYHEEDQPSHIVITNRDICRTECHHEYGNPCIHFCPANVFEWIEDEKGDGDIKLNPSNCVHCKTCAVKDPYQIIQWKTPESGGPRYGNM